MNLDDEDGQISETIEKLAALIIGKTLNMNREAFEPSIALASYLAIISIRIFSEQSMGRCSLADLASIVPFFWKSLEKGMSDLTNVNEESMLEARERLANCFLTMTLSVREGEKQRTTIH